VAGRSTRSLAIKGSTVRVELRAIDLARRYFVGEGYAVENVSRKRGHNGYDFIVTRDSVSSKIEVKGCSREWQIPDLFETEFDANKQLVADILCVVYFIDSQEPSICLIPRDAIAPSDVHPKRGYRISSRFKKRSALEKYWKPLGVKESLDG
jgi:hypothetical protein